MYGGTTQTFARHKKGVLNLLKKYKPYAANGTPHFDPKRSQYSSNQIDKRNDVLFTKKEEE